MNTLPLELESIILDMKNEMEYIEKMKKVFNQINQIDYKIEIIGDFITSERDDTTYTLWGHIYNSIENALEKMIGSLLHITKWFK